jgi:hypothetical protein
MATPPTGSPRGRPAGSRNAPKSILRDRDRFSIALAQGLILAGKSERQAYDLAVVLEPSLDKGLDHKNQPRVPRCRPGRRHAA